MLSSVEIAKSTRTLICLLQSLINRKILIELRNDHFVLGILQTVDCYMNTELSSAIIWNLDTWINHEEKKQPGEPILIDTDRLPDELWLQMQTHCDYLFLKGIRIRYVHLPENFNVIDGIERQLNTYRNRRSRGIQRPFNWKSYRKRLKAEKEFSGNTNANAPASEI